MTDPTPPTDACCDSAAQALCCAPADKVDCCGPDHGAGCGCSAGHEPPSASHPELRESVRRRYAAAAEHVATRHATACCTPADADVDAGVFGAALYDADDAGELPDAARLASLGCGNPTAVAELHEGETVLDLGSGGGIDVLLSARRVGPTGLAYGLDMTHEMLALARANQAQAGVENVQWLRGHIEDIPLPAESVDVVISNCVINLSTDKRAVLREAARVLRPGGRFAVSDVIADPDMDDATRADMQAYTGCIAGALTRDEFETALRVAGLTDVEVSETHRVHARAAAAIVRARKPSSSGPPPIACSLEPGALADRLAEISAVGAQALIGANSRSRPARLRFRAGADVRGRLAAIVAAEARCCPFLDLRLADEDDGTVLLIDAPPGAEPIVDDLVAAFGGQRSTATAR
jgi:arsenite methyltransferase